MVESPDPLTYHADFGVPGRQFSDSIAFAGDVQDARAISDKSKFKNASNTTDARLKACMVTHTPVHPVGVTTNDAFFWLCFSWVPLRAQDFRQLWALPTSKTPRRQPLFAWVKSDRLRRGQPCVKGLGHTRATRCGSVTLKLCGCLRPLGTTGTIW